MADLRRIRWDRFPARPKHHDRVSKNFWFGDLTRSDLADRLGIRNSFTSVTHVRAAVYLCRSVLQPMRDEFGAFSPNSVYRCQGLERALKKKPPSWSSSSQHTAGEACDVTIPGVATLELARWVERNLEFDQLICECYDPAKGPSSGWVHVSLRPPGARENRRQLLSYIFDHDRRSYVYVDGLRAMA